MGQMKTDNGQELMFHVPSKKKRCGCCKKVKPLRFFPKNRTTSADGYYHRCKLCDRRSCHKSREKIRKLLGTRAFRDKERVRSLRNKYGLTVDQYGEMCAQQNNLCAICSKPETTILRGAVRALCVDHDHATGKVRGLLCQDCNSGIGAFGENVETMLAAIAYVKKHNGEQ
jgi:hypothetical protein